MPNQTFTPNKFFFTNNKKKKKKKKKKKNIPLYLREGITKRGLNK
jgi:hypothetical protein